VFGWIFSGAHRFSVLHHRRFHLASPSCFATMDTLAPELLHLICAQLNYWEVPAFRLLNRQCAAVGLEYLVPTIGIHLHRNSFKVHSFQRLLAISSHPIMSKTVRELYYDSHILDSPMKDFATWKAGAEERVKEPNGGRVNGQILTFNPIRTRQDFVRLYSWYQTIMREQEHILDGMIDYPILAQAIPNLINLEKITMNTRNTIYRTDVYDRIGPWDYALEFPYEQLVPYGVRQLNSLLLGAASSRIELKKLRAGLLSWKWFKSNAFILNKHRYTRVCKSLTSLHLVLTCGGPGHPSEEGPEAPECYRYLEQSGKIPQFLAKLSRLESLKLSFDETNIWGGTKYPARLSHLIGDNPFWPGLKKLELGCFRTSELELMRVLERHAKTLLHFGLNISVELDAGGSW